MLRSIVTLLVLLLTGTTVRAAGGDPIPVPTSPPSATPGVSAEARYNEGLALAERGDWVGAEAAYRNALRMKAAFPEAWNGLGHSLKMQRKFDESIRAYQEALRLRPNYAQALEYLGEAYVQMGKMDEARAVLERLRPLDQRHAQELTRAILARSTAW
jgi:tetratricopeptide (TPR) repeat protein